jgi:hypothetical protein
MSVTFVMCKVSSRYLMPHPSCIWLDFPSDIFLETFSYFCQAKHWQRLWTLFQVGLKQDKAEVLDCQIKNFQLVLDVQRQHYKFSLVFAQGIRKLPTTNDFGLSISNLRIWWWLSKSYLLSLPSWICLMEFNFKRHQIVDSKGIYLGSSVNIFCK